MKQKAQLSLEKADRTAYVRIPESDFQSQETISQQLQFHTRYVNRTLLSKATINASIKIVALGHLVWRYK